MMVMHIKVFSSSHVPSLQDAINNFMVKEGDVVVDHIAQSQCTDKDGRVIVVVTLCYHLQG